MTLHEAANESMPLHTRELGFVTYEIQRSFGGAQPAAGLIRDMLAKQLPYPAVDAKRIPDVK